MVAQAKSGTGKTGTFAISILHRCDPALAATQALVLAPSRELAGQIADVIKGLASYMPLKAHAFTGGTRVDDDVRLLRGSAVHVVVGTPGRVYDLMKRGALRTAALRMLVLDEADEMLSEGFKDQIYAIFALGLPNDTQVCLFSATMPAEAQDITRKFMRDPVTILVKQEALTLEGLKQYHVAIDKPEWKLDTLCDLYDTLTVSQSIIFCNTRRTVEWLTAAMRDRDFTVSATHSTMDMRERMLIMKEFRSGATRVLITTDLLARGVDVQQVSVVINYDMPTDTPTYLHRIGRSARYGRKGLAINFITPRDVRCLRELEAYYSTVIPEMPANYADMM